ncbi:uncharacterized protein BDZ99DRAFT_467554, partial [Mytilinidion resinicola]
MTESRHHQHPKSQSSVTSTTKAEGDGCAGGVGLDTTGQRTGIGVASAWNGAFAIHPFKTYLQLLPPRHHDHRLEMITMENIDTHFKNHGCGPGSASQPHDRRLEMITMSGSGADGQGKERHHEGSRSHVRKLPTSAIMTGVSSSWVGGQGLALKADLEVAVVVIMLNIIASKRHH